jgi:Fe-S cluster biosynthesis and repair protein YggX
LDIFTRSMEWLGHVVKMEGSRLAKNILKSKMDKKSEKSVDTNNWWLRNWYKNIKKEDTTAWSSRQTRMGENHKENKVNLKWRNALEQYFSTFVRPWPGKFFFYKTRARSQKIVGLQAIFMTGHKQRYSLSRMLKDFDVWKFPIIHEYFHV